MNYISLKKSLSWKWLTVLNDKYHWHNSVANSELQGHWINRNGTKLAGELGHWEWCWTDIIGKSPWKHYIIIFSCCFQRWNRCVRFKVVRLSSLIPCDLRHAEQLLFLCPCSNLTVYRQKFCFLVVFFRPTSDVNISETVYPIYLKINVPRVASGDSLHFNC